MNGDVKIEIYDQNKNWCKAFLVGKGKGSTKFLELQDETTKGSGGRNKIRLWCFFAPQVLPGNYTIKLKVGDKELEDNILLRHLDEKNYTFEDRKLQYETSMKYFKMHEDLAKTVDDINKEQK